MKPKKTAATADPIAAALTAKLSALLSEPLTPRVLLEMEKTARLGRELLVVGKNPEALGKKPLGGLSFMSNPMYSPDEALEGSLTPAPPMETFGANALREIMAALPALMPKPTQPEGPTPTQQIMAIAYARERGLTDLAKQLEDKLMGVQTEVPAFLTKATAPKALESMDGVYLSAVGPNLIFVIKTVRQYTGWGLKDAKDFVEGVRQRENDEIKSARKVDGVLRNQFEECAQALRKAGATVTVQGGAP